MGFIRFRIFVSVSWLPASHLTLSLIISYQTPSLTGIPTGLSGLGLHQSWHSIRDCERHFFRRMGHSHTRRSTAQPSSGARGGEGTTETVSRHCVSPLFHFVLGACLTLHRSSSEESSHLFIYSLRTHEIIKKLAFPGLVSFAATDRFIVVVSPRH